MGVRDPGDRGRPCRNTYSAYGIILAGDLDLVGEIEGETICKGYSSSSSVLFWGTKKFTVFVLVFFTL